MGNILSPIVYGHCIITCGEIVSQKTSSPFHIIGAQKYKATHHGTLREIKESEEDLQSCPHTPEEVEKGNTTTYRSFHFHASLDDSIHKPRKTWMLSDGNCVRGNKAAYAMHRGGCKTVRMLKALTLRAVDSRLDENRCVRFITRSLPSNFGGGDQQIVSCLILEKQLMLNQMFKKKVPKNAKRTPPQHFMN